MDILHKGHLLMLRNAKKIAGSAGILVAGILTDEAAMEKKLRPTLSFEERIDIASAIKYVDVVVAQDTYSPVTNIKTIRPDVLMENPEHDAAVIAEARDFMHSIGGKVVALPYFPPQSSTKIKLKIKDV
jgi:cytidyltransferase-like protein